MHSDQRIHGFDVIRLIALYAIMGFHSSWAIWLSPSGPPDPFPTAYFRFWDIYARLFSFSGFTIVFMTSLLMGMKKRVSKKQYWLPIFLLTGWAIFWICTYFKERTLFVFQWDIYPYLIVGLLSSRWILSQNRKIKIGFTIGSFLMLWIPFWKMESARQFPMWLQQTLVGICPEDYADWPLFPWIGLFWLGSLAGNFLYSKKDKGPEYFHLRSWEYPLWGTLLAAYTALHARYYVTPLGDGWSCFTFRQETWIFWTHMFFWIGLMRFSLHPTVQSLLSRSKFIRAISSLAISRHFFLAYLWHYVILFSMIRFLDPQQKADNLLIVDTIGISLLPLCEIFTRCTIWAFSVRREKKSA